ncbi:MAG: hypothetical protein SFU25_00905 [Candidatus Caenarcaniphilales bacterium]|nr:hypothetical protein [Candidatus Caenarcaniphilales bacterium]
MKPIKKFDFALFQHKFEMNNLSQEYRESISCGWFKQRSSKKIRNYMGVLEGFSKNTIEENQNEQQ